MEQVITLIQAAVTFGTVILFGAMGEILTEKSGSLNLGVPGIMYLGGIASLAGAFLYENACSAAGTVPSPVLCVIIAMGCAFAAAALGGLLFSFLVITLRTNQNVTGLTLTIFSAGLANFFGGSMNALAGGVGQIRVAATSAAFQAKVPALSKLGIFSDIFLEYGFMVYLAVVIAICLSFYLNKTNAGLALRAIGENPATADATGVNVIRKKYIAACLGAGISGLGGLYYVMDYTRGTWANDGTIESLGWLAVALVIFATWRPTRSIWGAYLFGILYWLYFYISNLSRSTQELFRMLPYVVTIIVLIIVSLRRKRESQPPAALGLSYFREER